MTFLDVWIGYTIFGISLFSAIFVWAVRARQFSDLERGRYIPLSDNDNSEQKSDTDRQPAKIDKYTWVALALITIAAVTAALFIGMGRWN